jgi:hypothetical protein
MGKVVWFIFTSYLYIGKTRSPLLLVEKGITADAIAGGKIWRGEGEKKTMTLGNKRTGKRKVREMRSNREKEKN